MSKFKNVSLPTSVMDEVDSFIETHVSLGYTSTSDFIRDSIRRNLERLKKEKTI